MLSLHRIPPLLRYFGREVPGWRQIKATSQPLKTSPRYPITSPRTMTTAEAAQQDGLIRREECSVQVDVDQSRDDAISEASAKETDFSFINTDEEQPSNSQPQQEADATLSPEGHVQDVSSLLRTCMRQVPHPVAILTASTSEASSPPDDFSQSYGVTISSFTTVSLGPPAVVSFNLRTPSRTLDAIKSAGSFRISFLKSNKKSMSVAKTFLNQQHSAAFKSLQKTVQNVEVVSGLHARRTSELREIVLAPRFFHHVLFHISCAIMEDKCLQVGDHTIVVACVNSVSKHRKNHPPSLLYFDGDFGSAQHFPDSMAKRASSIEGQSAAAPNSASMTMNKVPKEIRRPSFRSVLSPAMNQAPEAAQESLREQNSQNKPRIRANVSLGQDGAFPTFYLEDHLTEKS